MPFLHLFIFCIGHSCRPRGMLSRQKRNSICVRPPTVLGGFVQLIRYGLCPCQIQIIYPLCFSASYLYFVKLFLLFQVIDRAAPIVEGQQREVGPMLHCKRAMRGRELRLTPNLCFNAAAFCTYLLAHSSKLGRYASVCATPYRSSKFRLAFGLSSSNCIMFCWRRAKFSSMHC